MNTPNKFKVLLSSGYDNDIYNESMTNSRNEFNSNKELNFSHMKLGSLNLHNSINFNLEKNTGKIHEGLECFETPTNKKKSMCTSKKTMNF